jgi:hypothetical protein
VRLSSVLRGLVAAGVGTACMDAVWYVRYRRGGGTSSPLDWEFSAGLDNWDDASAPAKVGKLLLESTGLPVPGPAVMNNLMHWAYGAGWGALLGVSIDQPWRARLTQGPLLGASVWLASYVSLPVAGVYKPIWSYDLKTLWKDLSAHLVYGLSTIAAFRAGG